MSEHHGAEFALIAVILGGAVGTLALMIGFQIMCAAF
jgi:hypothetical protein